MSKRKKPKPSEIVTKPMKPVTPEEVAAEIEDGERQPLEPPPPKPSEATTERIEGGIRPSNYPLPNTDDPEPDASEPEPLPPRPFPRPKD